MKDVLVIGAGVAGLSVALNLQARGQRVVLVERGAAGGESSWAGGGILCPLLPWEYAAPVNDLALRSMHAYPGWIARHEVLAGRDAEFLVSGMSVSGLTDAADAMRWCAAHGMLAEAGPSPDAIRLPGVAQVRNPRLVAVLRAAFLRQGGVLHEQCEARRLLGGTRARALDTTHGTLDFDRLVVASGAWAGPGLPGLPATPNIRPIRGQMLLFQLAPGTLDTILYHRGLYLIPRRDGHILVGSTLEDAGFDKTTDSATARRLHSDAAELLPALAAAQPVRHWAGLRPGAPDNLPLIDRHPDFDNVFVNAGHYRYGVTMAPASAELLADLMESKLPALDPAPYSWAAALERRWADGS